VNVSSWFKDSIGWAPLSGTSASGDPTYGATQTGIPARWERETVVVGHTADGAEIVSNDTIYTAAAIGLNDRVWIPGVSTTNPALARLALQVKAEKDKSGTAIFYKVRL
jgi:hypothetical protein